MGTDLIIVIVLLVVAGLIIISTTALKPEYFSLFSVFLTIITLSAMIYGYAILDEYILGCIILGFMIAIFIFKKRAVMGHHYDKIHHYVMALFIAYMLLQSIRGLFFTGDIRMARWILYFILLGLFLLLSQKFSLIVISPKQAILSVLLATSIYFFLYIITGFYAENFQQISKFDLQGFTWAGSAYAMFPLVLAIPAALLALKEEAKLYKYSGWVTLILIMFAGFYYDSRISWLTIFVFLCIAPKIIGFRKSLICFCIYLIFASSFIFQKNIFKGVTSFSEMFLRSCPTLLALIPKIGINLFPKDDKNGISDIMTSPRSSDMDRILHFHAAIAVARSNITTFLVGQGMYSHKILMVKHLKSLYAQFLPDVKFGDKVRTTGISALLVDTGIIGVLLLCLCLALTVKEILTKCKSYHYLFLTAIFFMFLWLFVSNLVDVVLFFLAIMPGGILVSLSQYSPKLEKR